NIYNKIMGIFNENYKIYNLVFNSDNPEELEKYLTNLDDEKKYIIIEKLKTINQKLNFENGENFDIYNTKILLKNILIKNINNNEYKEVLIRNSFYDLELLLNNNEINKKALESTINLLENNKEYILDSKYFIENMNIGGDIFDKISNLKNINLNDLQNFQNTAKEIGNSIFDFTKNLINK
ncbi:MAG: hypothetical protein NWP80_01870, partial [Candidatus Gracilibacteria bacterium]|nr:hypothetical protein [Candidatus Gracilibacteria bacterium]